MTKPHILLIGEPMLDTSVAVRMPARGSRMSLRRSALIVYEQIDRPVTTVGGALYSFRFLHHFADVRALIPLPSGGVQSDRLSTLIESERDHGQIESPRINATVYEAQRLLEMTESFEACQDNDARNFVRIDWGEANRLTDGDIETLDQKMLTSIRELRTRPRPRCILLADYDLGLFTEHFIERIASALATCDPNASIPIVVYASRRWRKYAPLKNCTIVAEHTDAAWDITEAESQEDAKALADDPFPWVASRFAGINNFVVVDTPCTKVGKWIHGHNHTIHGTRTELSTGRKGSFTPVGHTALIACIAALARANEIEPVHWLPIAHNAAALHLKVLTQTLTSNDLSNVKIALDAAAKKNSTSGRKQSGSGKVRAG